MDGIQREALINYRIIHGVTVSEGFMHLILEWPLTDSPQWNGEDEEHIVSDFFRDSIEKPSIALITRHNRDEGKVHFRRYKNKIRRTGCL